MKLIIYAVGNNIETAGHYGSASWLIKIFSWVWTIPSKRTSIDDRQEVITAFTKCKNIKYFLTEKKALAHASKQNKIYRSNNMIISSPAIFKIEAAPSACNAVFNVKKILSAKVLDYPLFNLNHDLTQKNEPSLPSSLANKTFSCTRYNFMGDFAKIKETDKMGEIIAKNYDALRLASLLEVFLKNVLYNVDSDCYDVMIERRKQGPEHQQDEKVLCFMDGTLCMSAIPRERPRNMYGKRSAERYHVEIKVPKNEHAHLLSLRTIDFQFNIYRVKERRNINNVLEENVHVDEVRNENFGIRMLSVRAMQPSSHLAFDFSFDHFVRQRDEEKENPLYVLIFSIHIAAAVLGGYDISVPIGIRLDPVQDNGIQIIELDQLNLKSYRPGAVSNRPRIGHERKQLADRYLQQDRVIRCTKKVALIIMEIESHTNKMQQRLHAEQENIWGVIRPLFEDVQAYIELLGRFDLNVAQRERFTRAIDECYSTILCFVVRNDGFQYNLPFIDALISKITTIPSRLALYILSAFLIGTQSMFLTRKKSMLEIKTRIRFLALAIKVDGRNSGINVFIERMVKQLPPNAPLTCDIQEVREIAGRDQRDLIAGPVAFWEHNSCLFNRSAKQQFIKNRSSSPEAQHAYDKQFGVQLYRVE